MGTFHHDKGPLHGITVVVDTHGPALYVGRCDDETPDGIILLDADRHEEATGGKSKAEYLSRASRFGVFPRHPRLEIPRSEIASVRRLGEI